jgi:hypothetical protein
MADDRNILQVLRDELAFVERGGYRRGSRFPWRPNFVFEDSPTCINFEDRDRPHPCKECMLIQFVPLDRRETRYPCRHIRLNSKGETVHSFYEWGSEEELETALKDWLQRTIGELEDGRKGQPERPNPPQDDKSRK